MKHFLSIITFLMMATSIHAATPPELIDNEYKAAYEKSSKQAWSKCKGAKNAALEMECVLKEKDKFAEDTKSIRRTDYYNDAHYGTLNESAAKNKLKELRKLYRAASKNNISLINAEPGELSYQLLQGEIWYLEKHLKELSTDPSLAEQAESMGLKNMAQKFRELTGDK